ELEGNLAGINLARMKGNGDIHYHRKTNLQGQNASFSTFFPCFVRKTPIIPRKDGTDKARAAGKRGACFAA
ncbi:MAG: hypothetical protein PHS41_12130, partial [Victivallaceae bacterium]|nr:hypothetical protein [Victivallaceae bacterium]